MGKSHKDRRKAYGILFVCLCLMSVLSFKQPVEAGTTCKSLIAYPAKTNGSVNIRKKAGTSYATYGMLSKNQDVTFLGYVTIDGTKWFKCKAKLNDKTITGYVCGTYLTREYPQTGVVNDKASDGLNVRKEKNTSSQKLAVIKKGTSVKVKSISKKSGVYWYKISVKVNGNTVTGYVSGAYIDITPKKNTSTTPSTSTSPSEGTSTEKIGYVNENVSSTLCVRKEANTSCEVLMQIPRNTKVIILGGVGSWYKAKVTYNGKTVTGYVAAYYITIQSDVSPEKPQEEKPQEEKPGDNTSNEEKDKPLTEEEFEESIKGFPSSYKTSLRALHKDYPNWRFKQISTGLDWSAVISNESIVGRNVIQSNYPKGTASLAPFSYLSTAAGAYKWNTDTYVVKDGSNWYAANSEVVAYYMDPRNFINATDIFQFEALAYDESQSGSIVQSILSNTFMKGEYSVTDSATGKKATGTYKQAFMDAGKNAKANPYFLATRVKQEVGVNGSNATSGTYKGYEGLYNFYNIGAYDGANAVANGLNWASGGVTKSTTYGRPWTTPYKSIVGGAQYIAANYINKGQNTLYFQKFNVASTDLKGAPLYTHQYMTNVQAPSSEGKITKNAYNSLGILSDTMVFFIPTYINMPSAACKLPASAGNPNPFLSDLSVYSGKTKLAMSATFSKPTEGGVLSNNTYSLAVGKSVSEVTIKASTISSKASVSGTGTVTLDEPGKTTKIKVTGVAQNGQKQEYVIMITRDTK
ncbi:MAG: SH3 domain-containing protein [Eubacteriales bacterium]|nr:SH3 domain-containing protein [Eubacteriales bacterium]